MMKKITLLLMLLTVSFGFSQTLPFDFQGTLHGFVGDADPGLVPVLSNGTGNDVLQITAVAADWDNAQVTFAAPIDLSDNANNTLRFTIQSTTAAPGEVHQHGVSFQTVAQASIEANFQTTGTDVLNVELNFGASLGSRAKMVIFTDVGNFGVQSATGGQSGTPTNGLSGTYIIDNISLGADPAPTCSDGIKNGNETGVDCGGPDCAACVPTCSDGIQNQGETGIDCGGPCSACPAPPTTGPTTPPARLAADVKSLFSNAYTNVAPSGVNVFAGATWANFTIVSADDTRKLTTPNPGGGAQFEYITGSPLDLTGFTHMHIDFFVEGAAPIGSVLQVFVQNWPSHPGGAGAQVINTQFDISAVGAQTWVSGDVLLSSFAGSGGLLNKVGLIQIVAAGPAYGPTYIDNIYFHKNTTLGTEDFAKSSFKTYPNPTQDSWTVQSKDINITSIKVYDILGKNVLSIAPNSTKATIEGSSLKSGLYFAKIESAQSSSTLKLVKK